MQRKAILICGVALTLGACGMQSGPRYTPRPEISQRNNTQANHVEDRMDKKSYNKYEEREQCQQYRRLPRNMVDPCAKAERDVTLANAQMSYYTQQQEEILPIVSTYTVLFDHDKSNIRGNEIETLDRAMQEIDTYNPRQVTVTGYTDSSGRIDYNQTLSREREHAVSKALLSRGIESQVLQREARGEYEQAVQTKDGIRNQDNRRVVIDFRR